MYELPISKKKLWEGCILTSIAHAISTANNPNFSYEQSWDGINYNVQDSNGTRGTITFYDGFVVAAFRNEESERLSKTNEAINYFINAENQIKTLAQKETFEYLLEEADGKKKPVITTVLWGENKIYSCDNYEEFILQSGDVLRIQFMEFNEAFEELKDYYEFSDKQIELMLALYEKKIKNINTEIKMTKNEIEKLESEDEEGLEESELLFNELNIIWE